MPHRTAAYTLALLTAALTLAGPESSLAATVSWLQEVERDTFETSEITNAAAFKRGLQTPDNDWFASQSLIEVDIDGRITFVTVQNIPDDTFWINRRFDFVACDGSVRVACDGSVIPSDTIVLDVAITKNPSVSVVWTITGSSQSNWAVGVVGGANPFDKDALLTGSFEAQMSLAYDVPSLEGVDTSGFAITQMDFMGETLSYFAGRLGDDGTISATTEIGTETDGFGGPVGLGAPLLIPAGTPGSPAIFTRLPDIDCVAICDRAEAGFRLAAPAPPSIAGAADGRRIVSGSMTFTYELAPPSAVIPLPAAGWLLLGGLGALGLLARRRRPA